MKNLRKIGMLFLMVLLYVIRLDAAAAEKQTIYSSPYVTFSPDGKAWTTNAGDANCTLYVEDEEDIKVMTGLLSSLRTLQTGEHFYNVIRQGEIPIQKWEVEHVYARCIHNAYPPEGDGYKGLDYGTKKCNRYYYSGWRAYCADCGERITDMYVYMSMEAAESIDYLEVSPNLDYYYLCPHCTNLEQGAPMAEHNCKAISWNQYKIVYEPNTDFGPYGGYMENSIHMYNNATEYEGETINAATHLTKNSYTRMGFEFVGWNTEANGTGTSYGDGVEIFNLTDKDWNETGDGIITLYAQWTPSQSTLEINPDGGTYEGRATITSITKSYGSSYVADGSKITPPSGHTITFETNGGSKVSPVTGTQSFKEWIMVPEFQGRVKDETYYFVAPNGNVDQLKASYSMDIITLPGTMLEGRSFGGWYADEEFTDYVGGEGTEIIPQEDMTLYALWVDLKLDAENNMTANGGKGAVDLSWSQADTKNKTYLLYQQEEDRQELGQDADDWVQVHSANDISSSYEVVETFLFTGSKKTYTVPYTGLYTLTVNGAQGGNYGDYEGGLGGRVTAKVWLNKGEVLTYNVGGQNGYNCGGTGKEYGSNGGGRTSIYSDQKGTILIAGGGGGASVNENGGDGGSSASLGAAKEYGESGHDGGGGGYVGGKAGEVIVHTHEDACFLDHVMLETTSSTLLIDENKAYNMDSWLSLFNSKYSAFATVTGSCYNVVTGLNSLRAHTTSANKFLVMEYGRISNPNAEAGNASTWYTTPDLSPSYTPGYIPVDGNKEVTIDVLLNGMHDEHLGGIDESQSYLKVCNQNGEQIFLKYSSEVTKTTTSNHDMLSLDTAATCKYINENHDAEAVRFVETISLPEGTESIYFTAQVMHTVDAWMEIDVNKVVFAGGRNNSVICGFAENQVISSKSAYGGSNYVNTNCISSYTNEKGKKQGNGSFSIQSERIGFLDGLELKNVVAEDCAEPATVSSTPEDIVRKAAGTDTIEISWKEPYDNGTVYYHKAESYEVGAQTLLCTSNITENTLISGIKGYYYRVDTSEKTEVTDRNGRFITERKVTVALKEQDQYLHIAAVDVADNIGGTAHIPLGNIEIVPDEVVVPWELITEQLGIDEGENVYRASSENVYYVRSDGKTPFTLNYEARVDGPVSLKYQLNYVIYESLCDAATMQNKFFLESDSVQADELVIGEERLQYSIEGATFLERYPYSEVIRSEYNRKLTAIQKFTLKADASGKTLQLYPRAGAATEEEIVYSDLAQDRTHGITLIGDGEAPVITGLEVLEDKENSNNSGENLSLQVTATDAISGVGEFYITVTNTDNIIERVYEPDADGKIRVEITGEEPIFNGNFVVTVYAVDNVGNEYVESYGITEFALNVTVERILEPHEPIFKCGESGVLRITTLGYAERVEVEFPEAMVQLNPELDYTYSYADAPQYRQQEQLQFMIPLYTPANESYTITVRAYKGDEELEAHPVLCTIEVGGDVLDELRTRLR